MRYVALLLLLAGCAVGPYAERPQYKPPETRAVAARHLNEALVFGGRGLSEVAANELYLTWNERRQLTDKRWLLLERRLEYRAILRIHRPRQPGEWWELHLDAAGGAVTFEFKDVESASKAEAALLRLAGALSLEERKRLARPHYNVIHRQLTEYRKFENEETAKNLNWRQIMQSIGDLELITDQSFDNDVGGVIDWESYLDEQFGFGN